MLVSCHPLTRRTLIAEYQTDIIRIDRKSPMVPMMLSRPLITKTPLRATIEIMADRQVEDAFHPHAGHNLYEYHMDKLVQYICRRVDMGHQAWTSMEEYYQAIQLDIDELAPETVYKRWQRFCWDRDEAKKANDLLTKHPPPVLNKLKAFRAGLPECMAIASALIASDPDRYMTTAGQPDRGMLKKAAMYIMTQQRWRLEQIATHFGETIPNVSYHVTTFKAMISAGDVVRVYATPLPQEQ